MRGVNFISSGRTLPGGVRYLEEKKAEHFGNIDEFRVQLQYLLKRHLFFKSKMIQHMARLYKNRNLQLRLVRL